ncbi:MAG: proline dehydrogenase family protein, partial [Acidimicrobiia bacterium]
MFSRVVTTTTRARPVEKVITQTRPGKALARRFVAGDTLEEAVHVARDLNRRGMLVSLDLLGEEVHNRDSARAARDEYLESLGQIAEQSLQANISVKLTQLGLAEEDELAAELLDSLAAEALRIGTTVTIDMEDSRYTESTVGIYEKAQANHGNLGLALQAYLHRTPGDLARLVPLGGHLRLCKGAYVEDAVIALS